MAEINTLKFNEGVSANLKKLKYGSNWPVVYIINNNEEAYVGETTDVSIRSNQHLANEVRRKLEKINVISDGEFNKSAVLDLESFLIKYMSADKRFKLQNGNGGLQNHNYYQREKYEKKFRDIWNQLRSKGLVKNDLRHIENTDLFKYSPYKSLTVEQYMVVNDILSVMLDDLKHDKTSIFVVNGGAGTGKTILGIYLLKLLTHNDSDGINVEEDSLGNMINSIRSLVGLDKALKIALVIPMENLRATLKKVFKGIKGLNSNMVLSPHEVGKSEEFYDLLIVDEAHRLRRRKNLTQYGTFDSNNKTFGLGKNGTELDWIMKKSKSQVFFYDENQSIKPTDITKESFECLMIRPNYHPYYLETQLRCLKGGNEYLDYVKAIFSDTPPKCKVDFKEYDFKLFDNVNVLVEEIKQKNNEYGLCRTVAGYSWEWKSKGTKLPMHITKDDYKKIIDNGLYDIEIDGYKYIWNTKITDWINSENSINEIGSIHTTQGFDLNYTGIIIGNEFKYDDINNKFVVDKKQYFDSKGKADTNENDLLRYIINIYTTMFARGMLGTYVYVCDPKLREYLKQYISTK